MNRKKRRELIKNKTKRAKMVEMLFKGMGINYTKPFAEGIRVRINMEKVTLGNPKRNNWIADHKNEIFTITYDPKYKNSMIYTFAEDITEPKWLFAHVELIEEKEGV